MKIIGWDYPDPDDLKYISEAELASLREQIQEDVRAYMDGMDEVIIDHLCWIVVNNFNKLKD